LLGLLNWGFFNFFSWSFCFSYRNHCSF
jgi:hypothetical protein